jgi:hypothetical protein
MLLGISQRFFVPTLDAAARNTAKPLSVRRHVDRKILRFSLSIGAVAALVTVFVFMASAYPSVRRWKRNNLRALSEINCAAEACDTSRFTRDWELEQPDYVIDTHRLYFIAFPISTEENPAHFAPLDYINTAFIREFRQPALYNTPDGEVWRLYSREASVGGNNVEILIGYAVKAPWKIVETLPSQIGAVDATLKREADEIAANPPTEKASARGSRLGPSADGFVVVDARTNHVEVWGPWLPAFLPNDTSLPGPGNQFCIHDDKLYVIETDTEGRLLATSCVDIGSLWWLAALCCIAFLSLSVLARALSRRFLRSYFALAGIRSPTLEEAQRTGEGQRVEFKRGLSDDETRSGSVDNELLKSIAAFANTNDGVIFIGVDDAGHVKGLELDFRQRDRLERKIRQLVRSRIKPTPPVQVVFEDVRGLTVAKISVARGEAPVYMTGGVIYLRYGSEDVQAQPEDLRRLVAEFAF